MRGCAGHGATREAVWWRRNDQMVTDVTPVTIRAATDRGAWRRSEPGREGGGEGVSEDRWLTLEVMVVLGKPEVVGIDGIDRGGHLPESKKMATLRPNTSARACVASGGSGENGGRAHGNLGFVRRGLQRRGDMAAGELGFRSGEEKRGWEREM